MSIRHKIALASWPFYLQSNKPYLACADVYLTRFPLNSPLPIASLAEIPEVTKDWCTKCSNKMDNGDQYTCCRDCSDPHIISDAGKPKLGYCQTGAELFVEPKENDSARIFKWVPGPWKPCSSPCDGGIRSRDVECYAVFEDTLLPDYSVYDHLCSSMEMPAREEPCNLRSCLELHDAGSLAGKQPRKPTWAVALLSFIGIMVIGGIGFAVYTLYKRRTSQYGHVYVMMDGYL
ncbi:hypothetical protein Tsubulata_041126 [Turnera subulata]|uniref:Uncharacterized protein n=1 Tax=Turnera subulata TaxID=218843 RepID=A0A9Q0FFI2_9ROSI|nr:hypothetical protein Tsubulata_041126 [Turnera subulata]